MCDVVDADDGIEEEPRNHDRGKQPAQVIGANPLEGVEEDQHRTGNPHHHPCSK